MTRLRANLIPGTLGAQLGANSTGIIFTAPLVLPDGTNVPTIISPDYYAVILEPDTVSEEIVWLTAYTAGATAGTVTRSAEPNTGPATLVHASGTPWRHGPTAIDFGFQITQNPFAMAAWDGANWRTVGSLSSLDSRALQGVMLETARLSVGLQCLLGTEITDADVISELRAFLDSDTAMANLATMLDQMRQPTLVYLRNVVAGNYLAAARDVVLADASAGAVVVQVPNGLNAVVSVKKVDSSANKVTITPSSGTIDGAANLILATQYQSRTTAGDGVNCWVI